MFLFFSHPQDKNRIEKNGENLLIINLFLWYPQCLVYYGNIQTPLRQTLELHSQMQTTGLPQKIHTSVTFVDFSNLSLSAFLEPYRSYRVGVSARWENKKHHVKI